MTLTKQTFSPKPQLNWQETGFLKETRFLDAWRSPNQTSESHYQRTNHRPWKWPNFPRATLLVGILLAVMLLGWATFPTPAAARTDEFKPVQPAPTSSIQPYLDRVKQKVTEFRLDNGLKFIVLERHEAPVVSFITYADVGGANEPVGKTGVAHFLEHLAFKGTTKIGTTNYAAEKELLNKLDEINDRISAAEKANRPSEVAKLKAEFAQVETEASKYIIQNQFGQIVQQSGGVGLNATTSADATRYFYSFPANKLELWMSLESERFLEPVFREFYKEKQVILEERRLRTDNSPIGQMVEVFLAEAFQVHPYRNPVIGYPQDLQNLTRADVREFFETYYTPNNMTIAIVGDVDPAEVKRLANIYFGRYPAPPSTPPQVEQVEPPQTQPREVTLRLPTQPWYLEGYHRPAVNDRDNAVYDMITAILSDGRTSRIYKSLIEEKQLALNAQGFSGFPGNKYPNLLLFYALTAPGHTVEEVAKALHTEIERLTNEPVSDLELERAKTKARADLLRSLNSNSGMASLLVEYQVKTGSWQNLFKQLESIEAVTAADIQRIAQATFVPENRTIGRLLPTE
ncbi:pitrilysin family protein [Planktothricoides raciborskii GIHE-MW2]|uniref:Pitrilysin family protein n=2 Tax=Planktothricoides raciborskii TaxID=132608 RepID=A0AAU8JJB4_9CYAN|nr:pitrilysin family protein [Planktothricoides raciborskii]